MITKYLFYSFLIVIISSFNFNEDLFKQSKTNYSRLNDEGLKLLKRHCYSCHSVKSRTYDKIKAPPMEIVKVKYKIEYQSKVEFTKAFTKWVLNPTKEKALMFEEIEKYKLMPKLPYYEEDILIIAEYIYSNELEKPKWFDSYYKNK